VIGLSPQTDQSPIHTAQPSHSVHQIAANQLELVSPGIVNDTRDAERCTGIEGGVDLLREWSAEVTETIHLFLQQFGVLLVDQPILLETLAQCAFAQPRQGVVRIA